MHDIRPDSVPSRKARSRLSVVFLGAVVLGVACGVFLLAQGPGQGQPTGTVVPKKAAPTQDPTTDSQGPAPTVGETVVVPRSPGPPKKQQKPHPPGELPPGETPYSIAVSVDLVTMDAQVEDNNGNFIPGLKKENFRVTEDGVPQTLQTMEAGEAPMTVVLLIEFDARFTRLYSQMWFQTLQVSYGFVSTLRKEDWLAITAFDLKPEILMDFSQSRAEAQQALGRLRYPSFSESCLFDALADTMDRLKDVAGKKGILLVSTGRDTLSHITYDTAMKKVKEGQVPIYAVSIGQFTRIVNEGRMGPIQNMDYLQADNALKTFAADSGGKAYFPRFEGEMPGVFGDVSQRMRHQYTLGFVSTNPAKDGKWRKVKIDVVDATGGPLKLVDQKGKEVKLKVVAKQGYVAAKGEIAVN
jgi:Ca-activated chloride channel family protein